VVPDGGPGILGTFAQCKLFATLDTFPDVEKRRLFRKRTRVKATMPGLSGSVGFDDVVAAAAAIGRGEMVVVSSFPCTAFSHQPICRPVANSVSRVLAKTRVWQTRNSWSSHQLIAAPTVVVVVVVRQGNAACRARVHLANCMLKAKQALVSSCARLGLRCRSCLSDGFCHQIFHHEHAHTFSTHHHVRRQPLCSPHEAHTNAPPTTPIVPHT
jgi:hypothetical protein